MATDDNTLFSLKASRNNKERRSWSTAPTERFGAAVQSSVSPIKKPKSKVQGVHNWGEQPLPNFRRKASEDEEQEINLLG